MGQELGPGQSQKPSSGMMSTFLSTMKENVYKTAIGITAVVGGLAVFKYWGSVRNWPGIRYFFGKSEDETDTEKSGPVQSAESKADVDALKTQLAGLKGELDAASRIGLDGALDPEQKKKIPDLQTKIASLQQEIRNRTVSCTDLGVESVLLGGAAATGTMALASTGLKVYPFTAPAGDKWTMRLGGFSLFLMLLYYLRRKCSCIGGDSDRPLFAKGCCLFARLTFELDFFNPSQTA